MSDNEHLVTRSDAGRCQGKVNGFRAGCAADYIRRSQKRFEVSLESLEFRAENKVPAGQNPLDSGIDLFSISLVMRLQIAEGDLQSSLPRVVWIGTPPGT